MFVLTEEDRNYIENKYHDTKKAFDPYNRREYHGYEYDFTTGMNDEEIAAGLERLTSELDGQPHPVIKAKAVAYVLENTAIDINCHDYFPGIYSWNRAIKKTTVYKWKKEYMDCVDAEDRRQYELFNKANVISMWPDFDHVVPDWESIIGLGFSGLIERSETYRNKFLSENRLDEERKAFFDGIKIEYEGVLTLIHRLETLARKQDHKKASIIADSLERIGKSAPQNTYDVLMTMYIYFMVCENVDYYQVRSLGNGLDNTLRPYWKRDIECGVYTEDELCGMLSYFFMQFSAIGNYWGHPFYLGGQDDNGDSTVDEVSFAILKTYRDLGIYNPKIQIKVCKTTPQKFIDYALDMVRCHEGNLVFCSDDNMIKAIMSYCHDHDEARNYDIRGCYETGVRANEVSTGAAYINMLKPVLFAFNDGVDENLHEQIGLHTGDVCNFVTFDDYYGAVMAQLDHLIDKALRITRILERSFEYVNPSSMYSATITHSLECGKDGYAGNVKYNNSSILCCGIGSLIDALMATKYLVYDKKAITIDELTKALANNWQGYEKIRAMALRCPHKYGNGDNDADRLGAEIAKRFADKVNSADNARGGKYKACMHSAMEFVWHGQKTGATPDGRAAGDEISKNGTPAIGADRKGVTATVISALKLTPVDFRESFCLDIMLHPSAVEGDDGLCVMRSVLYTYMRNGGMSIQFNVLNADMLREAQKYPEKYRNLQIRVCGWNVLWNNLSKAEQDSYIRRAESVAM